MGLTNTYIKKSPTFGGDPKNAVAEVHRRLEKLKMAGQAGREYERISLRLNRKTFVSRSAWCSLCWDIMARFGRFVNEVFLRYAFLSFGVVPSELRLCSAVFTLLEAINEEKDTYKVLFFRGVEERSRPFRQ